MFTLLKQFKLLAQFKFSVLNIIYYMQRFNVKFALDFTVIYYVLLYIVQFCRNPELFIYTQSRECHCFLISFVIFISVRNAFRAAFREKSGIFDCLDFDVLCADESAEEFVAQ